MFSAKEISVNVVCIHKRIEGKLTVFKKLFDAGISSIFVEAGSKLNGEIIKQNLADEIIQFTAPKILNDNTGISCFDGDKQTLISSAKCFRLAELKQITPDFYARYVRI